MPRRPSAQTHLRVRAHHARERVQRNVADVVVAIGEEAAKSVHSQHPQPADGLHRHDGLHTLVQHSVAGVAQAVRVGGHLRGRARPPKHCMACASKPGASPYAPPPHTWASTSLIASLAVASPRPSRRSSRRVATCRKGSLVPPTSYSASNRRVGALTCHARHASNKRALSPIPPHHLARCWT